MQAPKCVSLRDDAPPSLSSPLLRCDALAGTTQRRRRGSGNSTNSGQSGREGTSTAGWTRTTHRHHRSTPLCAPLWLLAVSGTEQQFLSVRFLCSQCGNSRTACRTCSIMVKMIYPLLYLKARWTCRMRSGSNGGIGGRFRIRHLFAHFVSIGFVVVRSFLSLGSCAAAHFSPRLRIRLRRCASCASPCTDLVPRLLSRHAARFLRTQGASCVQAAVVRPRRGVQGPLWQRAQSRSARRPSARRRVRSVCVFATEGCRMMRYRQGGDEDARRMRDPLHRDERSSPPSRSDAVQHQTNQHATNDRDGACSHDATAAAAPTQPLRPRATLLSHNRSSLTSSTDRPNRPRWFALEQLVHRLVPGVHIQRCMDRGGVLWICWIFRHAEGRCAGCTAVDAS